MRLMTNTTTKPKKRIFAIPAAPEAMPPNPKSAAISAKMKKIKAQRNMSPPSAGFPVSVSRYVCTRCANRVYQVSSTKGTPVRHNAPLHGVGAPRLADDIH